MDNQASSPQIIFPNVPDDFCPSGNWTQVLQAFIDEVLINGAINVPGLGNVTPAEITDINNELLSLQNQIDALPLKTGIGNPNGFVTASPGTLYLNSSGGATTTLWVKESGTGDTGWIAK
jgi:hypothetical protein